MSSKVKEKKPAPSHQHVKCKQCDVKKEWRYMQEHYKKNHPGKDYLECKGIETGALKRFFSNEAQVPKKDEDIEGPSAKITCLNIIQESSSRDENAKIAVPIESSEASSAMSISSEKLLHELNILKAGQNEILSALKSKSSDSTKTFSKAVSKEIKNTGNMTVTDEQYIVTAGNVEDLVSSIDWIIFCDIDKLRCSLCTYNDDYKPTLIGFFNTDQEFRYLKKAIKVHSNTVSHRLKIEQIEKEGEEKLRVSKKAEEVGMRIGSIAYQIIKQGEALHSFPQKLALLHQTGVFVGNINHSKGFIHSMLDPFVAIILDKLKQLINTPLACTDTKPPFALIDDKSRIKREDRHGIMIRVQVLKRNHFFKTFYVCQPVQEKGDKKSMSDTLFKSVSKDLDLKKEDLRQQFVCHAADGAIAKNLHIHTAHAEYLQLEEHFAKDMVLWDLAHKLELAAKHSKEKMNWLTNFDSDLDQLMTEMKTACERNKLIKICGEMNISFKEFDHFSTTRFMQYSFRTYESILHMWSPMIKLYETESASDENTALDAQFGFKVKLQDPTFLLKLIFMKEFSNIASTLSKQFQKQDSFPITSKQQAEAFLLKVKSIKADLSNGKCPQVEANENNKNPKIWELFNSAVGEISEKMTYQQQFLLFPTQQGRASRSVHKESDATNIIQNAFKDFSNYLVHFIAQFELYFVWPEWLILTESVFDFSLQNDLEKRLNCLEDLFEKPQAPQVLLDVERSRLKQEFITLNMVATKLAEDNKNITQESLYYKICTEKDNYRYCKTIIAFALRFLSRTFNECSVESEFSNIKHTDSEGRPHSHDTIEKLCFIKSNGPHSLTAKALVRKALAKRFNDGNWHFISNAHNFFTSTCIQNQHTKAKEEYSLFD